LSAISFDYPIGLVDQVMAIFYYDWENQKLYSLVRWQNTFDNWSFHLIGFWNPDQNLLFQNQAANNYLTGKGVQFLLTFNH